MDFYTQQGVFISPKKYKAKKVIKDPQYESSPIRAYAYHDLAVMYERGWDDCKKSIDKARRYFKLAAKAGHIKACTDMAYMHVNSCTVIRKSTDPIDYRKAGKYVELGQRHAQNPDLDMIYSESEKDHLLEDLNRLPGIIYFLRERRKDHPDLIL